MKTVLVTGGIASGKSAVCARLRALGLPVYDCDSRTKALYDEIPDLKARIEKAIGLPFAEVGIIFSDAAKREALEAVVFPEVLADIRRWKAGLGDASVAFIESAIAASKPVFDGEWDEIWRVDAPMAMRIARNPRTAERAAAQDPASVKADLIIENDGSLEELNSKIDNILKSI
ncbi:MAG: dephospho-CoA kinase [Bacteroidales bacterium]|nr:dephospho-CoA kinase [Bacteroidales bacterium]